VAACAVKASNDKIPNEWIIQEVKDFTISERDEETSEQEVIENFPNTLRDILVDFSEEKLLHLEKKGFFSREIKNIRENLSFWRTIPSGKRFLSLLDTEERIKALSDIDAVEKKWLKEIEPLLKDYTPVDFYHQEYVSVFDNDSEDGVMGFGFEQFEDQDAEEAPKSASVEEEAQADEIPINSEFLLDKEAEMIETHIEWEPRFISEVRLWPHGRKFFNPP